MTVIEATLDLSPNQANEFLAIAKEITLSSRNERGCLLYRFTRDLENVDRFHVLEIWENEESFKAHLASEEVKSFLEKFFSLGKFSESHCWQGALKPYALPSAETAGRG